MVAQAFERHASTGKSGFAGSITVTSRACQGNERIAGRLPRHTLHQKGLAMKISSVICTTVGALVLTGIATTMPAEARHFGPGLAGGVIAGALVAGAASSAYAYGPGPVYAYGSYEGGPGYYVPYGHPYETYGVYDESQHGGQPSYSQPW